LTALLEDRELSARTGPAVALTEVSKVFGRGNDAVTALTGVDLRVAPGEFVVLLGASGCGKTTLLNLIAGLDRPTTGRVDVAAHRPAVMFQEPALLPWLSAVRNVELPLRLSGVGRAARRSRAGELLDLVRLSGQSGKRPHELSGGMRQRVALARALAATTNDAAGAGGLLLMDEPFAALDAITRDFLQEELRRIWLATRTAVVFVTHDVREAVRLGQRVVLLSSRPGTVVREWSLGKETDRDALTVEITDRLRAVISDHAHA
jgi:NitT/TauT family transport system ATP-binding protein